MNTKKKIAINGFGRIGRLTFKALMQSTDLEVVAINDISNPETIAYLLKYDSTHGVLLENISTKGNFIKVGNRSVELFSQRDPEKLPWKLLNIDLVIESTGVFTDSTTLSKHIHAGAKKVLLSAPAKDNVRTIVYGVNENSLMKDDIIVSNASCTTNCLAPLAKILEDNFGIDRGFMTTVHAYTSDQNLLDAPHKDLRRARSATRSIIPTSTGAAKAVELVIPQLQGRLHSMAMRVPVENGSMIDFSVILKKNTSVDELNNAIKLSADTHLSDIMQYIEDPIVSVDIIGNKHSCIVDSKLSFVDKNFVKVVAWYDNEGAYAQRMVDVAAIMCKSIEK